MRNTFILSLIFLISIPVFSAENFDFKFQRKSYQFSLSTKGQDSFLNWKKSGFKVNKKTKLKPCFKKILDKEVLSVRNRLSSSSTKKLGGTKVLISWNGREISKTLLPREMDSLDKKFTHIFNLLKSGEGKCLK